MTYVQGHPAWWAVRITTVILRLLPPGGARDRWRVASTDDGSYRFRRCSRCGKERTYDDPGHWAGNIGQAAG